MRGCYRCESRNRGFTLVELITVLVILGFVTAIGSNFIVSTVDAYDRLQSRSKLINRGRLVIEQMTRRLRMAVPNSVRVSSSGNCVEFLPLVVGASYIGDVPDASNGSAAITNIATAPFELNTLTTAIHVVLGALDSGEIYSSGSPAGRVNAGTFVSAVSYSDIPLSTSHRFSRNSQSRRVYIADNPQRFCLQGSSLVNYTAYAFSTASLNDADPGGNTDLMVENVSSGSQAFTLSQGVEEINSVLEISLEFASRLEQISLNQKVLVRNVP